MSQEVPLRPVTGETPNFDDPNRPSPKLAQEVEDQFALLSSVAITTAFTDDPAMNALHIQTVNHLRHVRFDYAIDPDSPDYVHDYVLSGAYAARPSVQALAKSDEFMQVLYATPEAPIAYQERDRAAEAALLTEQKQITRRIINQPVEAYTAFQERLDQDGMEASFPEFASTLGLLRLRVLSGEDVQEQCVGNPQMEKFRALTLARLDAVLDDPSQAFPYTTSVLAMERAVEFFDVLKRAQYPDETPELYHSGRYEYYLHYLLAQKEHVIFPTTSSLSATDLITVRGVPIGFVGVNTEIERVDGFKQSPYEFFHHDVNHSRRMFQFFSETAQAQNVTISEFADHSNAFVHDTLLPLIKHSSTTEAEGGEGQRIAARMLLFEMLHEDALAADPDTMARAIMRPAMLRTPFEYIDNDKTVTYVMEPGATTLSYVFRKLAHTFYDSPNQRFAALGSEADRSRLEIVKAGVNLYRTVSNDPISDVELVKQLEQLVATDEGFPEAFMNEVLDDMQVRGADRKDTTFIVSKPTSAEVALDRVRSMGKTVHSIFGFSDLGYRDPAAVLQAVERDLHELNPSETVVAIGATEQGIGAAYKVAKDLGFVTLGIVSSKSIVYDGKYSDFVDQIVIVHDTEWGGYQDGSHELTPTTKVFVEASDSLAAYGGGMITAVSLAEAKKRGARVSYMAADMNPAISNSPDELQGAAYKAWQQLIK